MSEVKERAREWTVKGKERLLKTLSFVPDEQLTYQPTPTAKSALRIAAHCGTSNVGLAGIIRRKPPEMASLPDFMAQIEAEESKITTREQAIALLEETTQVVLDALDTVPDDAIDTEVPTPFLTAPLSFWMVLPGRHMDNHAAQIDYLQTCWGDLEFHI